MSAPHLWGIAAVWLIASASADLRAEGAYAFSQGSGGSWSTGGTWDHPTRAQSEEAAVTSCQKRQPYGATCQVIKSFNNTCFAFALQRGGNGYGWATNNDIDAARQAALVNCEARNPDCYIKDAFCDSVKEVVKTLICVRPIFAIEREFKSHIDGTPEKTSEVAEALNYLHSEFCRATEDEMTAEEQTHAGDNCYQMSGTFRGEKVYWGACFD